MITPHIDLFGYFKVPVYIDQGRVVVKGLKYAELDVDGFSELSVELKCTGLLVVIEVAMEVVDIVEMVGFHLFLCLLLTVTTNESTVVARLDVI